VKESRFDLKSLISNDDSHVSEQKLAETFAKKRCSNAVPLDVGRYFANAMQLPHSHCFGVAIKFKAAEHYFKSARYEVIDDHSVRLVAEINQGVWHIYPSNFIDIIVSYDYDYFLTWYKNDPDNAHELQPWTKDLNL